jgi:predicted Holliday junction resolvase-like endonuclease
LGSPIDFVVFEDDIICFVEVKTGRSQLTKKQRNIKKLVENKQIEWKTIRLK